MTNFPSKYYSDYIFLASGLSIVCALTYFKIEDQKVEEQRVSWLEAQSIRDSRLTPSPVFIATHPLEGGGYLSDTPISNHHFHLFVQSTGYKTTLEREKQDKTWDYPSEGLPTWQTSPDTPVRYLTVHDAQAFCHWLTEKQHLQGKWRLPTAKELEKGCIEGDDWYWTSQTLADFETGKQGYRQYKTAWKGSGELRHRRLADHDVELLSQTVFSLYCENK